MTKVDVKKTEHTPTEPEVNETVQQDTAVQEEAEAPERIVPETESMKETARAYQHETVWLAKVGLMILITFSCCVLVFFAVYRFDGLSSSLGRIMKTAEPIIMGLILAYLLNPIMRAAERGFLRLTMPRMKTEQNAKKLSRVLGIIVAILFLIVVIALLIAAVVPALISSISGLVESGSGYMKHFLEIMDKGIFGHFEVTEVVAKYLTMITEYVQKWAEGELLPRVQDYVAVATSGVFSALKALINFVIGIIVAVYVLTIKEKLIGQSKKLLFAVFRPKSANIILEVIRKADEVFGGFIVGKLIDSAVIGAICYIGCVLLLIPDAMLVAVIVGVTNVIPVFGPFIGAVPCLLLVVIQSPWHALYLLIFIVVLQQVDGNIIGPKLLGNSTGLSSFWVMFAILVGGGMFGFAGMLIGVPLFAMIYYIVRRLVNYGIQKRRLPTETDEYVKASGIDIASRSLLYAGEPKKKKRK